MSYLIAAPDLMAHATTELSSIGSALTAANAAAAVPTTGVLAAGADDVSAAVASLFAGHAQAYQSLGGQVAAFHQQFLEGCAEPAAPMRPPRRPTCRHCRICWG